MTQSKIISAANANRLYWLGRYEERVYTTLHLLRKCYDKMIDGEPADYASFWRRFDVNNTYASVQEFELGMLYDEHHPSSVLSAQLGALDNAMLLRNSITSETLSYLEMSVARLRRCKAERRMNINDLQPVTDWALAFFGSAEQRIENTMALDIIQTGRITEHIDMLLRFDYPVERVSFALDALQQRLERLPELADMAVAGQIRERLGGGICNADVRNALLGLINVAVRV